MERKGRRPNQQRKRDVRAEKHEKEKDVPSVSEWPDDAIVENWEETRELTPEVNRETREDEKRHARVDGSEASDEKEWHPDGISSNSEVIKARKTKVHLNAGPLPESQLYLL